MNMTASFRVSPGMNVETLIKALEAIPKQARVSVNVVRSDRWDADSYDLKFTWSV